MNVNENNIKFFKNFTTDKLKQKIKGTENKLDQLRERRELQSSVINEKREATLLGLREKYHEDKKYVEKQFDEKLDQVSTAYKKNAKLWETAIAEMNLAIVDKLKDAEAEVTADKAEAEAAVEI